MLCIAAAHDPIGYVAVAGRPLGVTDIARMTGGSENEVETLLGELDRNGVFSRDRHGRIYSRRMVADAKKAAIARKNGKTGGNPSLSNNKGNPTSDNPKDKGGVKPQEPRVRSQEEERETNVSLKSAASRRCPADWIPSPSVFVAGIERGLSRDDIDDEIAKIRVQEFRVPRKDWNATAIKWLITATQEAKRRDRPQPTRASIAREQRDANLERAFAASERIIDLEQRRSGGF